ncbi:Serine/arginine repetitive matrix protein 1 [Quillaja saponaria]|uniref:Serine/arginine repetitive matrix protein 1 n=1 Tax=Quillaja saponaria TaxID=32244 RepID=A0AAD7VLY1_QUISA|nr:Serine/arginine repetitive matrix protein 1 [Quillaja saponaria]
MYRSPRRRIVSPRRRPSPWGSRSPRRGFSYSRRRSRSLSRDRSPSPVRHRLHSPVRRRSPSPYRRRRSPSLVRRRRSPSPMRQRRSLSPARRRYPSPVQHRSRSPVRRRLRSPVRRRSRSPVQRRSPSPVRNESRSPLRRRYSRHRSPSPSQRRRPPIPKRSPTPPHRRSSSLDDRDSQSPVRKKSPKYRRSHGQSSREQIRIRESLSPISHLPSSSSRSPQIDKVQNSSHNKDQGSLSSPENSPILRGSAQARNKTISEDSRSISPYESPQRQRRGRSPDESLSPPRIPRQQKPRHDGPETSEEGEETNYSRENRGHTSKIEKRSMHEPLVSKRKDLTTKLSYKEHLSSETSSLASELYTRSGNMDLRRKDQVIKIDKSSGKGVHPGTPGQQKSPVNKEYLQGERQHMPSGEGRRSDEKNKSHSNHSKDSGQHHKTEAIPDSVGRIDHGKRKTSYDPGSEESDKNKREGKDKRKHRRSERKQVDSDDSYSYESELEGKKEAKRRKKEERKLRKEERRRRREERRRRKEERRSGKLKMKNKRDDYDSDSEDAERKVAHPSDDEESPSEQKKLEIELRKKALESLNAKRGISS